MIKIIPVIIRRVLGRRKRSAAIVLVELENGEPRRMLARREVKGDPRAQALAWGGWEKERLEQKGEDVQLGEVVEVEEEEHENHY